MTKLAENCEDIRKELSELNSVKLGVISIKIGRYELEVYNYPSHKNPINDIVLNSEVVYVVIDHGIGFLNDPIFDCVRDIKYQYGDGLPMTPDRLCQTIMHLRRVMKLKAFL